MKWEWLGLAVLGGLALASWCAWYGPIARIQMAKHDAAWAGFADPRPDGLTRFQHECRAIIDRVTSEYGFVWSEERVDGEQASLIARIDALGSSIWLDADQIIFESPERTWTWDWAETPTAMQGWLEVELTVVCAFGQSEQLAQREPQA